MQSALVFLIKTVSDLYLLTYLLRFILQWVRASYRNPLAQFVLTVTNPLVVPARRFLPSIAGIDVPTLVVLIGLECLFTWVLLALVGVAVPLPTYLFYVVLRLVALTLWFYTVAVFIYVILSWFADRAYGSMAAMLAELVEPLLRPVRRMLPTIAGLDLSPLLLLLLFQAAVMALPLPLFLR